MNKINYLTDSLLTDDKIIHGFFTRQGGVSQDEFASLNVSLSSGDDPDKVRENRKRVCNAMGVENTHLVLNKQVHSAKAVFVDAPVTDNVNVEADGLVTTQKNLLLGVTGADCPPVLFADLDHHVIGAAHSGWKGAKAGILEATIDLMVQKGATLENIKAVIGPAIDQKSYEVDQGFYDSFEEKKFFIPSMRENHYQFDLKGYCTKRLSDKGIIHISDLKIDTYTDVTRFFSNRRRHHMGEERFGVCVHTIGLR